MYNPEMVINGFIEIRKEGKMMFEIKQQKLADGLSVFQILEDDKVKESFVAESKTDKEIEKWQAELNGTEKPKRKKK